jgi:hypothetical protein
MQLKTIDKQAPFEPKLRNPKAETRKKSETRNPNQFKGLENAFGSPEPKSLFAACEEFRP